MTDYRHLDKSDPFMVELPFRKLAESIIQKNYGAVRFLNHLVDARREAHAQRIEDYRKQGKLDVAEYVAREGDKLADGIEALLKSGLF